MVRDAEANAEEDKKERAKIDARNEADGLAYSTEKSLKDYGDKVSAEEKSAIESALAEVKTVLANTNATAEEIKEKSDALQQAAYKLAEEVYKDTNPQGAPGAGPEGPQGPQGGAGDAPNANAGNSNDANGAEDADFEVVD